jgi:hypothetical protein
MYSSKLGKFLAQIDCRLQVIENKAANFPASGKRNWAGLIFLTNVPLGNAVGVPEASLIWLGFGGLAPEFKKNNPAGALAGESAFFV